MERQEWCQDYEQDRGFLRCVFEDHEFAYWVKCDLNFMWTAGYNDDEIGRYDHPSDAIAAVEKAIAERSRALKREKRK